MPHPLVSPLQSITLITLADLDSQAFLFFKPVRYSMGCDPCRSSARQGAFGAYAVHRYFYPPLTTTSTVSRRRDSLRRRFFLQHVFSSRALASLSSAPPTPASSRLIYPRSQPPGAGRLRQGFLSLLGQRPTRRPLSLLRPRRLAASACSSLDELLVGLCWLQDSLSSRLPRTAGGTVGLAPLGRCAPHLLLARWSTPQLLHHQVFPPSGGLVPPTPSVWYHYSDAVRPLLRTHDL